MYNLTKKYASALTHPMGALMQHAKRNQKSSNFLRGRQPNSHWWNVSDSSVLSKTQTNNNEILCSVGLYARNNSFITDDKRQ